MWQSKVTLIQENFILFFIFTRDINIIEKKLLRYQQEQEDLNWGQNIQIEELMYINSKSFAQSTFNAHAVTDLQHDSLELYLSNLYSPS